MLADHSIKLLFDNAKICSYIFCICSTFIHYLNKDNLQEHLKKNREHNLVLAPCRARRGFFQRWFLFSWCSQAICLCHGTHGSLLPKPLNGPSPLRNRKSIMMADIRVLVCHQFKRLWHRLHPFLPTFNHLERILPPMLNFIIQKICELTCCLIPIQIK